MTANYFIKLEEKLLLRDLSCRIPYGCKILSIDNKKTYTLKSISNDYKVNVSKYNIGFNVTSVLPFLRHTKDMTPKEREEYEKLSKENPIAAAEWMYRKHFDCNGLLEKGLAVCVGEGTEVYRKYKITEN